MSPEPAVVTRRTIALPPRSAGTPINRPGCIARLHDLWRQERNLGHPVPADEATISLDTLTDAALVTLGKRVAARVKGYQEESPVLALARAGEYARAREAAQQDADPHGALVFVDDAERQGLVREIRTLWAEERAARWLCPSDEGALDLDTLPLPDLRTLRTRIADRSMFRPEEDRFAHPLPDGWWWVTPWQAWHPVHGTTAIYRDRADALQEVFRHTPPPVRERPPLETMEDLFGEPMRCESPKRTSRRKGVHHHE